LDVRGSLQARFGSTVNKARNGYTRMLPYLISDPIAKESSLGHIGIEIYGFPYIPFPSAIS